MLPAATIPPAETPIMARTTDNAYILLLSDHSRQYCNRIYFRLLRILFCILIGLSSLNTLVLALCRAYTASATNSQCIVWVIQASFDRGYKVSTVMLLQLFTSFKLLNC